MNSRALDQTPWGSSLRRWPCTIVTGATSGIGRALALRLAGAGVRVVAVGRNREALRSLAAHSPLIVACAADLSRIYELPALVAGLVADHPDVGAVINNAGVQHNLRWDDAGHHLGAVRHEVDVNLVAPMVLTQCLLPHLQARGHGVVVNITSGLAYVPKRSAAVYSATKAGLHLFTQALRLQLPGPAVRLVEVVMPLVDTPMTAGRGRGKLSADQAAQQLIAGVLAGRQDLHIGKARWLPVLQRWAPGVLARVMQRD